MPSCSSENKARFRHRIFRGRDRQPPHSVGTPRSQHRKSRPCPASTRSPALTPRSTRCGARRPHRATRPRPPRCRPAGATPRPARPRRLPHTRKPARSPARRARENSARPTASLQSQPKVPASPPASLGAASGSSNSACPPRNSERSAPPYATLAASDCLHTQVFWSSSARPFYVDEHRVVKCAVQCQKPACPLGGMPCDKPFWAGSILSEDSHRTHLCSHCKAGRD